MKVNLLLATLATIGGVAAAFTDFSGKNGLYPDWKYENRRINGERIRFVSATCLAGQLYDKEQGIKLVDMRSGESFDRYHIPGAIRYSGKEELEALPGVEKFILYGSAGDDQVLELAGSMQGKALVLQGGIEAWYDLVLFPDFSRYQVRNGEKLEEIIRQSRYFGGSPKQMQLLNITVRENSFREGC